MRISIVYVFVFLCFVACKKSSSIDDAEILVKVGERTLKRSEITSLIPRGASSADSLLLAESFVKKWVKDILVYDVALRNLDDEKAEIDKLVEEYRNSLFRYRYQERLIRERLTADIRESDKLNYYDDNQKKFLLDNSLVKGLFLKIPVNAPGLNDVKSWYKQTSAEALEKIEKYSVQNATIYDYFYDRWVDFDEVMDNIPLQVSNQNEFLRTNKFVEVQDSSYFYLLNIKEFLPSGKVAPYDYVSPRIMELLINQRKVEFLRRFENELYNDAVKAGKVEFSDEP